MIDKFESFDKSQALSESGGNFKDGDFVLYSSGTDLTHQKTVEAEKTALNQR